MRLWSPLLRPTSQGRFAATMTKTIGDAGGTGNDTYGNWGSYIRTQAYSSV